MNDNHVEMEPASLVISPSGRNSLHEFITPAQDHHVVAHLGIARVHTPACWVLKVEGNVSHPLELSLEDVKALPSRSVVAALECAGNPLKPDRPLRRVSTAFWSGVPLYELLGRAGMLEGSRYVWLRGADYGCFAGEDVDCYVKDLPIDKMRDVLIAYEMNSEPLTPEHGFPIRAIVPGFYGTNSVKWLSGIEVAAKRVGGLFTTRLYNRLLPHGSGSTQEPVWHVDVNSMFIKPRSGEALTLGENEVIGWAWGGHEVVRVEVSTDGGETWHDADVGCPRIDYAWQPFRSTWTAARSGQYELMIRATDDEGVSQPSTLCINQCQKLGVTVGPHGVSVV